MGPNSHNFFFGGVGQELWCRGYGRTLMFWRSWCESQCHILDGPFSHYIVVKNECLFEKTKIIEKETGDCLFLLKQHFQLSFKYLFQIRRRLRIFLSFCQLSAEPHRQWRRHCADASITQRRVYVALQWRYRHTSKKIPVAVYKSLKTKVSYLHLEMINNFAA